MAASNGTSTAQCPVLNGEMSNTNAGARGNGDWWPNQLNFRRCCTQNPTIGSIRWTTGFDYAEAFKSRPSTSSRSSRKTSTALMTDSRRTGGRPIMGTTAR